MAHGAQLVEVWCTAQVQAARLQPRAACAVAGSAWPRAPSPAPWTGAPSSSDERSACKAPSPAAHGGGTDACALVGPAATTAIYSTYCMGKQCPAHFASFHLCGAPPATMLAPQASPHHQAGFLSLTWMPQAVAARGARTGGRTVRV